MVQDLKEQLNAQSTAEAATEQEDLVEINGTKFTLTPEQIFLGLKADNKEEAIRFAGEQLVKAGFVEPSYVDAMLEREKLVST